MSRPSRRDLLVAAVVVALDALVFFSPTPTLDVGPDPGTAVAVGLDVLWALLTLPVLAFRGLRPRLVLAAVSLLSVVSSLLLTCRPTISVCVALAALAARLPARALVLPALPAVAAWVAWVANELAHGGGGDQLPVVVGIAATYAVALAAAVGFGRWQGRGQRREAELVAQGSRAVTDERARVARELHDVVAHSVTVMALQSAGARAVMRKDADRAAEALQQVEATGAQAVEELRRMLGALRGPAGSGQSQDADDAGLQRIPELVAAARGAGREVLVSHRGVEREVDAATQHAVFRIVQEGVTNALKHAGPGPIAIDLHWGADRLEVGVTSPAADAGGPRVPSTGLGLRGLVERVESLAGTATAGPSPSGAWVLRAWLPLGAEGTTADGHVGIPAGGGW